MTIEQEIIVQNILAANCFLSDEEMEFLEEELCN